MSFAEILFLNIADSYIYKIPENLKVYPGLLVTVNFKNRKKTGTVVSVKEKTEFDGKIKSILEVPEPEISIPHQLLELAKWISDYYKTPLSRVIRCFLPPLFLWEQKKRFFLRDRNYIPEIEKEKKVIECLSKAQSSLLFETIVRRVGFSPLSILKKLKEKGVVEETLKIPRVPRPRKFGIPITVEYQIPKKMSGEQKKIYREIISTRDKFKVHLIHGVTGSGKTLIYLKVIQEIMSGGRSAILLVPEISLVPQMLYMFQETFKDKLLLWGSSLSKGERLFSFLKCRESPCVVVGPRSAIFAPVKNPGIIVIDEEQEGAYKEENPPHYNAREVGIIRAKMENIPIILGSATPQVETYFNAKKNKYVEHRLTRRVDGYSFPRIKILDLKKEKSPNFLSITLIETIKETLKRKKQVLLFLNRRGFSHFLQCKECGFVWTCENCNITMVLHKTKKRLVCHYCGCEKFPEDTCPKCGGINFLYSGHGTEKVEEGLKELFEDVKIARMDMDTTRHRGLVFSTFEKFKRGEIDILLGTQMVAKGFDFPDLALVCVLYADLSWNFPDFRARERSFNLLSQVIGRARRGGYALIQTMNPENPVLIYLQTGNTNRFYKEELKERKELLYPPYTRLALLEFNYREKELAWEKAWEIKENIHPANGLNVLGPAPAPLEKLKGFYRIRILLKANNSNILSSHLNSLVPLSKKNPFKIQVDPLNFL